MEEFGTGVITGLAKGRFDNQYDVEITLTDGTKLNGFDGISVYEKKQDGSPSKVWPNVKKSFADGVAYAWKGNTKQIDTKGGPKVYATITYAEGPENSDGAGQTPTNSFPRAGSSPPSDHSTWGNPPADTWGGRPAETSTVDPTTATYKGDDMQNQIVASWAIKSAIQTLGPNANADSIHTRAHELIVLKERIAKELGE